MPRCGRSQERSSDQNPSGRRDTTSSEDGSPPPAKPDVTVVPSSGFPQPLRPSPGADEWSRAASAHPPFRFLASQAGAALHLDSGSFTGVPASLCPCPSTVVAVRGVTPGLGLLRRLCRHTGHRSAPGDPAVTQIGEATGCSVRHLSPLPGVGRDRWGGAWKVSPVSPSTLSRSTASTIAAVAPTSDPMAGVRAVSLSPITSCADPPGSRVVCPFGPFPDMLLSPVSFEITAHHWAEVSRRTQLPDELLTSKSWFILLIRATTAHFHRIDVD